MNGHNGVLVTKPRGKLVGQVVERVALLREDHQFPAQLVGIKHFRQIERLRQPLPFGVVAGAAKL